MEFILTYRTDSTTGYGVMTIYGSDLYNALFDYDGSQDDIISIVRVF